MSEVPLYLAAVEEVIKVYPNPRAWSRLLTHGEQRFLMTLGWIEPEIAQYPKST